MSTDPPATRGPSPADMPARMPPRRLVVAIDGPSGSGKSSVSRAVARRLGAAYLDTGAMYRALTWWLLDEGVDLADADLVGQLSPTAPLEVGLDPERPRIGAGGVDLAVEVRSERITAAVSAVATNLVVRADMRRRQRELIDVGVADRGAIVAEGRDITTVVAPDAQVRILLTAREEARLARRSLQDKGTADAQAVASVREAVVARDAVDSTVSQFTTAADGVVTVDSSELDFDQTVAAVLSLVAARSRPATVHGPGLR